MLFLHTEQSNDAPRPGDNAHSTDVLLPESILRSRHEGSAYTRLQRCARRVRESIVRMEMLGWLGHGGRRGTGCFLEAWMDGGVEVGSSKRVAGVQVRCVEASTI